MEPKIFYTSCTTEIVTKMFSELKRLQNSWVQILYCINTYPQFWDLLGTVRSAKNLVRAIRVLSAEEFLQC